MSTRTPSFDIDCRRCESLPERPPRCPHSLVGDIVDERYRIDGVLGIGGMGVVYAARELGLDREVALKMLWPCEGYDCSLASRLLNIFAMLAHHPKPTQDWKISGRSWSR